jgi:16S rRNA (guanine966-N2)-methyltransferase
VRIISGNRKGKRLRAPSNLPVRPTTDFAKEALFNIINNHFDIEDTDVLDLFAGTGNISYEFASRGAADILAVEIHPQSVQYIIKTALQLEFHQLKCIKADAIHFLRTSRMAKDIIFADPPFDFEHTDLIPQLVFENKLLKVGGWLVVEHSTRTSLGDHPNIFDVRKYGSVCFSFFRNETITENNE